MNCQLINMVSAINTRIRGSEISNPMTWIAIEIFNFLLFSFISDCRFNKYLKSIKTLKSKLNTVHAPAIKNEGWRWILGTGSTFKMTRTQE